MKGGGIMTTTETILLLNLLVEVVNVTVGICMLVGAISKKNNRPSADRAII